MTYNVFGGMLNLTQSQSQVKLWDPLRTHAIPERLRGVSTTRQIHVYLCLHLYLYFMLLAVFSYLCWLAKRGHDELMLMYSSHSVVCSEANELLLLLCCRTLNVNMRNLCVNMPKIKGRFISPIQQTHVQGGPKKRTILKSVWLLYVMR